MSSISGFEIREASYEDIPAIQEITREAFEKYVELAGIGNHIEALDETHDSIMADIDRKHVFVAFLDGTPVGSVRVEILENNTAYLSRFGVRLDYQNSGIGKALMRVVDKVMSEAGIKKIVLHTASKVTSLVRFYSARGFYIDSTTKDRGYIRAMLVKDYGQEQPVFVQNKRRSSN